MYGHEHFSTASALLTEGATLMKQSAAEGMAGKEADADIHLADAVVAMLGMVGNALLAQAAAQQTANIIAAQMLPQNSNVLHDRDLLVPFR